MLRPGRRGGMAGPAREADPGGVVAGLRGFLIALRPVQPTAAGDREAAFISPGQEEKYQGWELAHPAWRMASR